MFKILRTQTLGTGIKLFVLDAPRIARKQRPGQFVILRLHDQGERIPLTIEDSDPEAGTINIAVQAIGKTTHLLSMLNEGDYVLDVVGPLGHPSEVRNYGTVAVIAGSIGTAMAYPTARALKQAGNHVIFIEGARRKDLVVLEDEVRAVSDETYMMTDDGSHGEQGLVTAKLQQLFDAGWKIDFVLAVGPVPMMAAVANLTRPRKIRTVVSLNSIMVDGTGMCGGCRVLVGNTSKFACVDGPDFDAEEVNFEVLTRRNQMYRNNERRSLEEFLANPEKDLALVHDSCRLREVEAHATACGQRSK
ncbi:MAG TPA: sulfide/dihydroorotate dehydrogenase-like FAD/NAD-binding protein [Clostridia bacterium]|nr:sulfide/dihydroorotate dehydrogenase-like FAD/NAD-binding protein [Clostridia bacterium]